MKFDKNTFLRKKKRGKWVLFPDVSAFVTSLHHPERAIRNLSGNMMKARNTRGIKGHFCPRTEFLSKFKDKYPLFSSKIIYIHFSRTTFVMEQIIF